MTSRKEKGTSGNSESSRDGLIKRDEKGKLLILFDSFWESSKTLLWFEKERKGGQQEFMRTVGVAGFESSWEFWANEGGGALEQLQWRWEETLNRLHHYLRPPAAFFVITLPRQMQNEMHNMHCIYAKTTLETSLFGEALESNSFEKILLWWLCSSSKSSILERSYYKTVADEIPEKHDSSILKQTLNHLDLWSNNYWLSNIRQITQNILRVHCNLHFAP